MVFSEFKNGQLAELSEAHGDWMLGEPAHQSYLSVSAVKGLELPGQALEQDCDCCSAPIVALNATKYCGKCFLTLTVEQRQAAKASRAAFSVSKALATELPRSNPPIIAPQRNGDSPARSQGVPRKVPKSKAKAVSARQPNGTYRNEGGFTGGRRKGFFDPSQGAHRRECKTLSPTLDAAYSPPLSELELNRIKSNPHAKRTPREAHWLAKEEDTTHKSTRQGAAEAKAHRPETMIKQTEIVKLAAKKRSDAARNETSKTEDEQLKAMYGIGTARTRKW